MTQVIAINNHKGGVAKTTTCLSLGGALAELNYTVLMIDLDPQAHLSLSLGVNPAQLHRHIGDSLLRKSSLVSVSRESSVLGLDIAPATPRLATVEKLLYGQEGYEFNLKQRIAAIDSGMYDFVLIDSPPSMGPLTLNALTAADLLIIPVQAEYYASLSLKQLGNLAKLVQQRTNPDLRYRVLVTMYDRRNKICRVILNQLQNEIKPMLFDTIIEVDTKLRESPAFNKPITTYAPKTRSAEQYRALAKELLNQNGRP